MKKLRLLSLCTISLSAFAQFPNPAHFNTATNATATGTLLVHTNDLHWEASLTSTAGPYVPAVSCGKVYGTWVTSPYPNCNWISYPHTCSGSDPAEHSCLNPASLEIYYRLMFTLPASGCGQSVSTPSNYCLSFDFFADNSVYRIYVNGNVSYQNPSPSYYALDYAQGNSKTVSLCNYWQPGTNTVIVHVQSGQGIAPTWEALLAQLNQTVNPGGGTAIVLTTTVNNATCTGMANGSATVSATGGGSSHTYTWMPSGGNANVATNLAPGIYTIAVTSNTCTETTTISIGEGSPLAVTVSTSVARCPGSKVTFTASGASTYTWLPSNATGSVASLTPTTTTLFTVTASNGTCTTKKTFVQSVLVCSSISEEIAALHSFLMAPNPAHGLVTFHGLTPGAELLIFDFNGRQMSKATVNETTYVMNSGVLSPGLYFVTQTVNGISARKKLVVQNSE
jgi:hypothetical protein